MDLLFYTLFKNYQKKSHLKVHDQIPNGFSM